MNLSEITVKSSRAIHTLKRCLRKIRHLTRPFTCDIIVQIRVLYHSSNGREGPILSLRRLKRRDDTIDTLKRRLRKIRHLTRPFMCDTIVQIRVLYQSSNGREGSILSLRRLERREDTIDTLKRRIRKRRHLTRSLTCDTIVQIRVLYQSNNGREGPILSLRRFERREDTMTYKVFI
jgi:hypothetical protein